MEIDVLEGTYVDLKTETVVLGFFEDEGFTPAIRYFDEAARLNGVLARAAQKKHLTGEWRQLRAYSLPGKPETLLLVGLGKRALWSAERLRRASALSVRAAQQYGPSCTTALHLLGPRSPELNARDVAIGVTLGEYTFNTYKTPTKETPKLQRMILLDTEKHKPNFLRGVRDGAIIASSTNAARELVNTPAQDLPPRTLASEAKRLAKETGCNVDVWSKKDLEKKGFNAVLAVAKGSSEEAQFIVIEYGPRKAKPIVFVGKGVTFDSGGLSIKYPSSAMEDMKTDMGGAAAVIGILRAAAALKLQHRVIGLIPAVENMINGSALRPGDVIKTLSGVTVEVKNTDAEGRLILADALTYAETLQPQVIIDFATLTGAVERALGPYYAGVFTRNELLHSRVLAAAAASGELVWRLPLSDDYVEHIKSDVADIQNIGKDANAGATTAAVFLEKFVTKTPWVHLDIAGVASQTTEKDGMAKGATGWGVRLGVELLRSWENIE